MLGWYCRAPGLCETKCEPTWSWMQGWKIESHAVVAPALERGLSVEKPIFMYMSLFCVGGCLQRYTCIMSVRIEMLSTISNYSCYSTYARTTLKWSSLIAWISVWVIPCKCDMTCIIRTKISKCFFFIKYLLQNWKGYIWFQSF